jgi:hypothetical protein
MSLKCDFPNDGISFIIDWKLIRLNSLFIETPQAVKGSLRLWPSVGEILNGGDFHFFLLIRLKDSFASIGRGKVVKVSDS